MSDQEFLIAGAEVEIRRLDDSGAGYKAAVVGPADQEGDYKLRWAKAGGVPDGAPRVGALVRLIRRGVTGDARAVRGLVQSVGANGLVVHTTGAVSDYEKRGFDRVSVSFALSYRKLTDAEVHQLRADIAGSATAQAVKAASSALAGAPSSADSPAMRRIEQKLDIILGHLGLAATAAAPGAGGAAGAAGGRAHTGPGGALGRKTATAVDLSGSGLRFRADEPLSQGDQLEIRFEVPGGANRVRALLEVVRQVEGNDVAGRFKAMSEASRSVVVRHVFDLRRRDRADSFRKAG